MLEHWELRRVKLKIPERPEADFIYRTMPWGRRTADPERFPVPQCHEWALRVRRDVPENRFGAADVHAKIVALLSYLLVLTLSQTI